MVATMFALIILFILSFFFSGSETALFSIKQVQLIKLSREKKELFQKIDDMVKKSQIFLIVILFGNTLANITASSLSYRVFVDLGFKNPGLMNIAFMSIFVIIFCEILPKTIAIHSNVKFLSSAIFPLKLFKGLFYPFIYLVNGINGFFMRTIGSFFPIEKSNVRTNELFILLQKYGFQDLNRSEKIIQQNLLRLTNKSLRSIIVHRSLIDGIDIEDDNSVIQEKLKSYIHDHIVVYRENIDSMLGVFHVKKLIERKGEDLKEYISENIENPEFIPDTVDISKIFLDLGKMNKPLFIVDEYGGIEGMVDPTKLLDILTRPDEDYIKKVGNNVYIVDAETSLFELEIMLGMDIHTKDEMSILEFFFSNLESGFKPDTALRFDQLIITPNEYKGKMISDFRVIVDDN